jgi:viroplasmin and RNaseH domain-containing protein
MILGYLFTHLFFILFTGSRKYNGMLCYVMFCGRKHRVYDSWRVYSGYVLGFSGADYQSYFTRLEVEEAYATFF